MTPHLQVLDLPSSGFAGLQLSLLWDVTDALSRPKWSIPVSSPETRTIIALVKRLKKNDLPPMHVEFLQWCIMLYTPSLISGSHVGLEFARTQSNCLKLRDSLVLHGYIPGFSTYLPPSLLGCQCPTSHFLLAPQNLVRRKPRQYSPVLSPDFCVPCHAQRVSTFPYSLSSLGVKGSSSRTNHR